jgi:NADH-ubiquinone oxidoreductase chain 4
LGWADLALGSLATLRQVDLKKIVAYSSIVHMGLLPFVLFSQVDASITGALLMMLAHGLVSPALFIMVGQLFDRHHTEFMVYLGGVASVMPFWRVAFFLLTLANAGLPLFPDFIAEFLVLGCLFTVHPLHSFLVCAMLVLPSAYGFWAFARVTFPGVRSALAGRCWVAFLSWVSTFAFVLPKQHCFGWTQCTRVAGTTG